MLKTGLVCFHRKTESVWEITGFLIYGSVFGEIKNQDCTGFFEPWLLLQLDLKRVKP
jgi:hypothetical protein